MKKISLSIEHLQDLLNLQRHSCANHISRNLSVYNWHKDLPNDKIDKSKLELRDEAIKAPYPQDFEMLKKYLSD